MATAQLEEFIRRPPTASSYHSDLDASPRSFPIDILNSIPAISIPSIDMHQKTTTKWRPAMRFTAPNRLEARRIANGIVANLIASYFEVGQPDVYGEECGAKPKDIDRIRAELQILQDRHERYSRRYSS